jgi:hypothetical protein
MGIFSHLSRKIRGPRHHLTPEEKAWIETRLLWLRDQFGPDPIRRAPLDVSSPLMPKTWSGTEAEGVDLFWKLCDFMQIERSRLELDFYSEEESHQIESPAAGEFSRQGPAGLYYHAVKGQPIVIALEETSLQLPARLISTTCHELGHVHLLADQRIEMDAEDSEPLTDLLTIYFGAGILTANTAFQFNQWTDGQMQGWSTSRLGYLTEAQLGYALACYAWYRGDTETAWRKHLRENITYYFDDSLHYLSTTKDTTIPFNGA